MELSLQELKELTYSALRTNEPNNHGKAIVIADRGHVWVGDVATSADWCIIANGSCVRRWGTTRGLGELAEKGPLQNTELDPVTEVRLAMRALIAIIPCKESAWKR